MNNIEQLKQKRAEEMRKKYANATGLQLLQLKKQIKLMKAMPQLVAVRNERLEQQNSYNNKMDYDKLRNIVAHEVPPNQLNRDTTTRAIDLLSTRNPPHRSPLHSNRSAPYGNRKTKNI